MKYSTKYRMVGLLSACLIVVAAAYGREGSPAARRDGSRLCVKLAIVPGI